MSRFDTIDLSQLPAPEVIEQLDFEAYLAEFKADFLALCEAEGIDYDVSALESDPIVMVLQVASQRETKLRGVVNDKCKAIMLAYTQRSDLDGLAALYSLRRAVVTPATATEPAVMEADERYRARVQGAPEALSVAGPFGAYVHLALRSDPSIKHVQTFSIEGTGEVHVLPLVDTGDGTPSSELIERIHLALSKDDAVPGTDIPVVRPPLVTHYQTALKLLVKRGPDRSAIEAVARSQVEAYLRSRHRVGDPVYLTGITAAAKVGGVENVIVDAPLSDLVPARDAAFWCSHIAIISEVVA